MTIPTFPGDSDQQFRFFPDELSDSAKDAITTYLDTAKSAGDKDILSRTSRVIGSLAVFADGNLPPHAYDVAALMPLARQLEHPNQPLRYRAASDGLFQYFTRTDRPPTRTGGYVGTLLGDMPHLRASAGAYRERLDDVQRRIFEGDEPISKRQWLDFTVGADIPEIARIHDKTNVESQLIMAADAVDRIAHESDDDQELFDHIIRAESFHSVPLEVYGFHAFDMMLQSAAGKKRVLRSGNEQVLEQTTKIIERAKNIETEDILYHYFGVHPKQHAFQTAHEPLYDEPIIFSSTHLPELSPGAEQGILHARFKTIGKYALKTLRNDHYDIEGIEDMKLPSDLFGMLAVVPDEEALGKLFAQLIHRAMKNEAIELKTAASKERPFFVKGSPDYVQRVFEQLPPELHRHVQVEEIKNAPADHIYQVAKFTSILHIGNETLPVEFQFQTEADRANARLGRPSHMSHNAGKGVGASRIIPGTEDDLQKIYARKHKIDPNGEYVNRYSIPNGYEMRRRYLSSLR
ncbi:MAG TPA: hypothetical protein PKD28_02060 [Candidatus Saccharibacteria bacterium]|nr:hypothetical protein [Candidatus Saccharibacteria bacterium]